MRRPSLPPCITCGSIALLFAGLIEIAAAGTPLSYEDRVAAQRAIERVYRWHRSGPKGIGEAQSGTLVEARVRDYLAQSIALQRYWGAPITRESLRRELRRIEGATRLPDRLAEIRAALGGDERLLLETFVRAALADRLSRRFLSADERAQQPARVEAERIRLDLIEGRLDPDEHHPRRVIVPAEKEEETDVLGMARSDGLRTAAGSRRRATETPASLVELRDAFELTVRLPGPGPEPGSLAVYRVPKVSWPEWWGENRARFEPEEPVDVVFEDDEVVQPLGEENRAVPTAEPSGAMLQGSSCAPLDLWARGHLDDMPEGRSSTTAVWTGSEMIVWGGAAISGKLNTGARYDPLLDSWTAISTLGAPAARDFHTAVWTGSEMIVWGGDLGGNFQNTGGRYNPGTDTWTSTSTVGAPSARIDHTAVWTGSRMIVWGGRTNTGGQYDPATDYWTSTSLVNAPSARIEHTAVWTGTEMIVWGGSFTNTGGRYNPATDSWTATSTVSAPTGRQAHTAVWTGSEMIVWGSPTGTQPTGGRYDPLTNQWAATSQPGAPTNRHSHTAVWTGSEMIVWGGTDSSQNPSGGWQLTGGRYDPQTDSWAATALINAPPARSGHEAVWADGLMIVWGASGATGGRYSSSTNTWTPTNAAREFPDERLGMTGVWTGAEMIVWGGVQASRVNTGGRYDPLMDQWSHTSTLDAPSPRDLHTAVWTGSEMIVWGGDPGSAAGTSTGGRYDPALDTWSPTSQANGPEARQGHTAVWTGSEMIVWGGRGASLLSSGGRYDPATDTWTPTSLTMPPDAREGHTAVWTGSEMIVWGGASTNTGGRYDPSSDAWSSTESVGSPPGGSGYRSIWTGSEMIAWDGTTGNPGGRYDPDLNAWTSLSLTGAPTVSTGLFSSSVVWTGSEMVVWGGQFVDFSNFTPRSVSTGARYDPDSDTWSPTTTLGAASDRFDHVAIWTGSAMIVWGGAYYRGDVEFLRDDRQVVWYGGTSAAPPVDSDLDGSPACLDCDDSDPSAWATPGEALDLVFFSDTGTIGWSAPTLLGAAAVGYDTLRSTISSDFQSPAVCIETNDGSDTLAFDGAIPNPGEARYFLVRARNACPRPAGLGPLGTPPGGSPRTGRTCP